MRSPEPGETGLEHGAFMSPVLFASLQA
jgi:hypothetical protein